MPITAQEAVSTHRFVLQNARLDTSCPTLGQMVISGPVAAASKIL